MGALAVVVMVLQIVAGPGLLTVGTHLAAAAVLVITAGTMWIFWWA